MINLIIYVVFINLVKIPKNKLNNEERFLLACLHPTNMKSDLFQILEYLENLFGTITLVNQKGYEDFVVYYTIEKGLTHFYSSKIKLYVDDYEEEEEKPIEPV